MPEVKDGYQEILEQELDRLKVLLQQIQDGHYRLEGVQDRRGTITVDDFGENGPVKYITDKRRVTLELVEVHPGKAARQVVAYPEPPTITDFLQRLFTPSPIAPEVDNG